MIRAACDWYDAHGAQPSVAALVLLAVVLFALDARKRLGARR